MHLSEPNTTEAADRMPKRDALVRDLAHAFCKQGAFVEIDPSHKNPQTTIDADNKLLDFVIADRAQGSSRGGRAIRAWRNTRALVVPRVFRNRENFALAVRQCSEPVALRRSGGSAVFHGPHVLNVSLAIPPVPLAEFDIPQCYGQLGSAILPLLLALGVDAQLGDVAAAHCPGRYSIVSNGRKLGGTAAHTRRTSAGISAIVHACISLWPIEQDLAEITAFDRQMGLDTSYKPEAHISLDELLSGVLIATNTDGGT